YAGRMSSMPPFGRGIMRGASAAAPAIPLPSTAVIGFAALLFIAVLTVPDRASAQKTYSSSVSRHRDVPALSEAEARSILAKASKVLKKDRSHNDNDDMACDVTLTLAGPVRTFVLPGGAVIDEDNIEDVHDVDSGLAGDFHIKVVKEIQFCRQGRAGPFNG